MDSLRFPGSVVMSTVVNRNVIDNLLSDEKSRYLELVIMDAFKNIRFSPQRATLFCRDVFQYDRGTNDISISKKYHISC